MSKSQSNLNKQLTSLIPDSLISFFEIDFSNLQVDFENLSDLYGVNFGAEAKYRFCPMINNSNPVIWQGVSYQPLPIKMEGFDSSSDGKLPRPMLSMANPEGIFSKISHSNQDFSNCQVTRKRTYARFLDDENFQNKNLNEKGKNPFGAADPNSHLLDDVYFINKKVSENKQVIQFELVSALEFEGSWVPARIVMADYCNWTYRCSIGCGYKGLPIETQEGRVLYNDIDPDKNSSIAEWDRNKSEYEVGDVVVVEGKVYKNPQKRVPQVFVCNKQHKDVSMHHPYLDSRYWLKDECSKTLESCSKRFGRSKLDLIPYNRADQTYEGLRFGGFPGTEKYNVQG